MRPSNRRKLCAAASLSLSSVAPSAAADDARVTAQALFDDAVQAMKDKAYDRACPKLEEVVALQPGKVGAMLQLAQCYEESGKIASAWSRYRGAADAAAPGDARGPRARAKADELGKRVPKLTVAVAPADRSIPGFVVRRGGREMGSSEWDVALPVDPGRYEIVASAPGKKPWSQPVEVVAGGATARVEIPVLPDGEEPRPALTGQKAAGVALMGASAVGLVLGSAFAAKAHASYASLLAACPSRTGCSPGLASQLESYHTASGTFVGSFIGAGALLGTGIVVFVTAPKTAPHSGRDGGHPQTPGAFVAPQLGVGYAGVAGGF
jgi:serine/threonine-protein kinase